MTKRWGENRESRRELLKSGVAGMGLGALHRVLRGAPQKVQTQHDLALLSIEEAASLVRRKAVSPVELTRTCLDRIEKLNPILNAFITVTAETAMARARAAEGQIQRGQWQGLLHGIPVALKDLFDTAGVRTTAASALFANRVPEQ